jgi:hypothetical protein
MHIAYNLKMASSISSRLSKAQWSLKPQDLAVAFMLAVSKGERLPYAKLGMQMALSPFEAHAAVARLTQARLLTEYEGRLELVMPAFKPFVIYGAAYFFPAVRGEITVGFPTAHAMEPLKSKLMPSTELPPVWPHPEGQTRGMSLLPLYPKLPMAAKQDEKLYQTLALFDALRSGQARERELVQGLLEEALSAKGQA